MAAMKAKHGFGALERVDDSIKSGVLDSYDILFVKDSEGKPYVGWVSKDGKKEIVDPYAGVTKLETQVEAELANKANAAEVEAQLATKASAEDVQAVEAKVNAKADAQEVEEKLSAKADAAEVEEKLSAKADSETVAALKTELATKVTAEEVEAKVEAKIEEVETKVGKYASKTYEIAKVPEGTLVDYFDKEIRIMIPKATDFANFNNGIAGVENMRYVEIRTYVPENAVGYKSDLDGMVMAGKVEDFAGFTDEYGKVYIITFPSIAYYNTESAAWVYCGADSTTKHYTGYNYTVEWFDENGVAIASDSVKINLSNEDCHYAVEPYYVGEMLAEVDAKIEEKVETLVEEKIKEVETSYEIVEF